MRLNILAFAAGVLVLQVQPTLPEAWPWALAGGAGVAIAAMCPRPGRAVLMIVSCLALGFAWAAWRADLRLMQQLPASWEGQDVEVEGVVAGLPQDFANGTRFEFDVNFRSTVEVPTERFPRRIMVSWYQGRQVEADAPLLAVLPGERWRMTVRLKRPHGNANPGGFDYEAWLLERNIRATGYVRPRPAERLAEMVWAPAYVVERLRYRVREHFLTILPPERYPWSGILVALAVGDQRAVNGEWWTVFNRTGTTHLMSISGLHVTMLAGFAGWLVSFLWRRQPALALRLPAQKAGLVAAAFSALLYALLAGFAVPAQRTLYMLLVAAVAMLSGRLVAPSRILAMALLVVLLVDPWAGLAAGFWLSFGAVAALLFVGAALIGEASGWREKFKAWGVTQWAATLASFPILLLIFQQLSVVSPLANAIAIPVVSFIVTPLALLGAVLPWWPILWLAHAVMDILMVFLGWCATWPVYQAPAPPLWAAAVAGLGVLVCLLPRGVPGRSLGILLMLPALFWVVEPVPDGEARIDILDVGQGLASVVRTRSHVLIYDPGPLYSAESDAGQRVVVPYLRYLGINRVDMLMVTHRDTDHSGGLASVQAGLAVGELRSSVPGIGGEPCNAGQQWTWDGVDFTVLHPAAAAVAPDRKANHLSCVLKVSAGRRSMLLTADIEAPDELELLARSPEALAADVLLVPHHGSRTSSTPAFLAAVGAPDVVIPVGYRNRFGHPKAEVVERYAAQGARIWRTDRDGAVSIHLRAENPELLSWRQIHPRYWQGQ